MNVRVRLFALARDVVGQEAILVSLAEGATVSDLKQHLAADYPALSSALKLSLVAVNTEYAGGSRVLLETDDIALIPPVSGG